jgi:hypothetical protein
MPKVTVKISPLVWFIVAGEKRDGTANRDDGGLIGQFLDFLHSSNIHHARAGGVVSPGWLSFGFHPDDAPAIAAWLKARGVQEEEQNIVFSRAQFEAAAKTPQPSPP